MVNRFSTGLLVGGMIGAIGIGLAMNDKMTKRSMIRNGKKFMYRAEDVLDSMADSVADTIESIT